MDVDAECTFLKRRTFRDVEDQETRQLLVEHISHAKYVRKWAMSS
jgi:hypothetical protein